jgi:hypothetical protein
MADDEAAIERLAGVAPTVRERVAAGRQGRGGPAPSTP